LREAQAQGFRLAIVPQGNAPRTAPSGVRVIAVTRIAAALEAAFARSG
jgi:DNA repair protein RadA/Sms